MVFAASMDGCFHAVCQFSSAFPAAAFQVNWARFGFLVMER